MSQFKIRGPISLRSLSQNAVHQASLDFMVLGEEKLKLWESELIQLPSTVKESLVESIEDFIGPNFVAIINISAGNSMGTFPARYFCLLAHNMSFDAFYSNSNEAEEAWKASLATIPTYLQMILEESIRIMNSHLEDWRERYLFHISVLHLMVTGH